MDTKITKESGRVDRNRSGKLVYLTIGTKFTGLSPQLEPITQPPGLHLYDEEGTITSKYQILFREGHQEQTWREEAVIGGRVEEKLEWSERFFFSFVGPPWHWHRVPLGRLASVEVG